MKSRKPGSSCQEYTVPLPLKSFLNKEPKGKIEWLFPKIKILALYIM